MLLGRASCRLVYLLIQLSRSQVVVYNGWLQTGVTHSSHKASSLRLQLLGNGYILRLHTQQNKGSSYNTGWETVSTQQGVRPKLWCFSSTCSPLTTLGPTLQQRTSVVRVRMRQAQQ